MATLTVTGSKGHHTFTVTLETVSTIPSTANTCYAYVTLTMYGGTYDFAYTSKSVSWSLNVGGYPFSGSFGTYTKNSTLTLVSRQKITCDVSAGDLGVTLNVTDGINASYTTGDVSKNWTVDNFTTYYFTSVGKPGTPIITQNSDCSLLFKVAIGAAGTNNTADDVHLYYRWGNSTVSSSTYDGSINLTYNSTSTYYEGTIPASTVVAKNVKSIYAVAYTIGQRSNSAASSVGSKTDVVAYTGVGAPTNVTVTYLATQNKLRVTCNAGTSGTNNAVKGLLFCWEVEGTDGNGTIPYTWYNRYSSNTADHGKVSVSCAAQSKQTFDIPLKNANVRWYTFVIYTEGTYNSNYGGDYAGIHVIRNSYEGNVISGATSHTIHNVAYGYTEAISDFSCYRINQMWTNAYDYYVTAGTSTVGINICGIGYDLKYYADAARTDLIKRESYTDFCSAGVFVGGRFYYPDVPVNHIYVTIEMYTLYDNTGSPSAIGPMTTYTMEMTCYTSCISPRIVFPSLDTGTRKFLPVTVSLSNTYLFVPIRFSGAVDGENNSITSFTVQLFDYSNPDNSVLLRSISVDLGDVGTNDVREVNVPLNDIMDILGTNEPILIRVLAYSSEWGEMWFPTESPTLENGWNANEVVLYVMPTGYVYQKVGTQQQPAYVYTKVNGKWKIANPDLYCKVTGSWKGTPNTSLPTSIYDLDV